MNKNIGSYITIAIGIIVFAAAIYVLLSASASNWRYTYCNSSTAHAIECTEKGWW